MATAVFDELIDGGVLEHGREQGEFLGEALQAMAERLGPERVLETRGAGLLRAIELPAVEGGAAPVVIARCREQGVLVIQAGANVLRLAPPLIIERAQLDEGLAVLEAAIAAG